MTLLMLLGLTALSGLPAPAQTPQALPPSRLVCEVPVRKVLWSDLSVLGIPEGSRPRDVALTRGTIWILFEPNLLVGLPRDGTPQKPQEIDEIETVFGAPGDQWETLSVSPRDGSIWIASSTQARLWRKPPIGRVRPVPVAGVVAGVTEGGFRDVLAGWDGVYVVPTACGAGEGSSIWRLDATGKKLGSALPTMERQDTQPCPRVDLETDWSGRTLALNPATGEAWRLETGGSRWSPAPAGFAAPGPWPKEAGPFRGWFFWGEEPVGLGGEDETIFVRRSDAGAQAFREDCGAGNRLLRVAGDRRGWVALTRDWFLLGEHALQLTP